MPGAPFNPATGERAPLGAYPGRGTTLALFQVVGDDPQDPATADTHDNYVVCRGYEADFDPNFRYLHDPYTKPDTTPINVAKPYSARGTFPYTQGQVIVAARIKNRLGYNAAKATAPTVGQPEDLEDELELLLDDDDKGIAWLDISTPQPVAYDVAHIGSALGQAVPALTAMPLLARVESVDRLFPMSGFLTTQPIQALRVPADGNYIAHFSGNVQITDATPALGELVMVGFAIATSDTLVVDSSKIFQAYAQAIVEYRSGGALLLTTNWPMSVTVPLCLRKDEYLQCINASSGADIRVYHGLFSLRRIDGYKEAPSV